MDEVLILLFGMLVIGAIMIGLVVAISTGPGRRIRQLTARIDRLEAALAGLQAKIEPGAPADTRGPIVEAVRVEPSTISRGNAPPHDPMSPEQGAIDWELFIGQKALGWTAVATLLFATAFFIRYAFENAWIGPTGRVCLGLLAGALLVVVGRRVRQRGLPIFAQMLTAAGIVLLYLSTYSAFGFYHLISQQAASIFLTVLIVEAGLLSLVFEAWAIALMALIGGLLTPLLMGAEVDEYRSLFLYLGMLNLGSLTLLQRRNWPAIRTVALLGTQSIFWAWYSQNYHPEKIFWALGFQALIFLLHLGLGWLAPIRRNDLPTWEEIVDQALNAAVWFGAVEQLLAPEDSAWLAPFAIGMAAIYAGVARWVIGRANLARLVGLAIALASSYLAIAWPLYAASPWNALGWAAEAAVLWWFGLRITVPPYRWLAAALYLWAVGNVAFEVPSPIRDQPFPLLFNRYALPALAATTCLIVGLAAGARWLSKVAPAERLLAGAATAIALLLAGSIVSNDLAFYFRETREEPRMAEMSISIWWSVYATALLIAGWWLRRSFLRWLSLAIFALTTLKVFLVDLANLDQIVRILAFFVLAMLLGLAAWIYQRAVPAKSNLPPVSGE